jgi:hypothetical protein
MINDFEINKNGIIVYLDNKKSRRKTTIIDQKTLNLLLKRSCKLYIGDQDGYVFVYFKDTKKKIRLHRWIMNCPDNLVVDHINCLKRDNRKENLQIITREENSKLIKRRA